MVDTIESLKAKLGGEPVFPENVSLPSASVNNDVVNDQIDYLNSGFGSPSSLAFPPSGGSQIPTLPDIGFNVGPDSQQGTLSASDWSVAMSSSATHAASTTVALKKPNAVWTHEAFLSATLVGSNGPVPWWDIYYNHIHPKFPIIFKTWFLKHYKDLPLILLHAMYCTSMGYTNGPIEEGEVHFSACKAVIDEAIENPDPLKTAAVMLMGVYSINSKRVKSAVSYLCLAIRFCQILGVDKDNYEVWKTNLGLIPGFERENPKDFCRSLWCCLYAQDFYAIFLIGVPGSVTLDIDTSYLAEYRNGSFENSVNGAKKYVIPLIRLTFSNSYLCYCSYYIPLLAIGRKSLRLIGNEEKVVLSRTMLLNRLSDWYKTVTQYAPYPESAESFALMYDMSFLNVMYHFICLQLLKVEFLDACESGDASSPVIAKVMSSADSISKSIQFYLKYNPKLSNLTLLMKYCVLFGAAIHCAQMTLQQYNAGRKMSQLQYHITFLEIFGVMHPQCLFDAKTILEWSKAPFNAISFLKEAI